MSMQQQPDMPPFSPAGWRGPAGAPSPISSRPPAPAPGQQQQLDELVAAASGSGSGSLNGQEGLAGEEGERGGSSSAGNRWPRQETLALLKIRSEMDAAFREAALKGPLWEDVSRRLAEMGYRRSAKKCREKFENVDKYYRRTKDGRAGRGDGKTYRFFSELEALHGAAHHPTPVTVAPPAAAKVTPTTISVASGPSPAPLPPPVVPQPAPSRATDAAALVVTVGDASFSGSEGSDGEDTDETAEGGKRKRRSWSGCGGGGGGKAMRFFEGLVRQVMERQEAMQQRLLETIERRDQERMIREEAWRRQEVARLAREQDQLAHERAVAASRDAAVVSFIQRVTGQIVPVPTSIPAPATITSLKSPPLQPTPVVSAAPAPPPLQHHQAPPVQAPQHTMAMPTQPRTPMPHVMPMPARPQTPQPPSKEIVRVAPEPQETTAGAGGCGGGASPSRWPKAEVHALIQLRTEMETRYQDAAPKGPLWEDISAGMRRLGYSRSAKRCKEKWENINKYFKKVKESSRKRPEDSKTCPYFHQLDALYRTKALATSGVNAASPRPDQAAVTVLAAVPLSQTAPAHVEHGGKNCSNGNGNGNGNGCASNGGSSGGTQMKVSNGGAVASFSSVEGAGNGVATNMLGSKQEGAVKEMTTEQPATMNTSYGNHRSVDNDMDSDSMDEEDEDDFDDDEDDAGGGRNMQVQYDIHFQRQQHHQQNLPNVNGGGAGGSNAPAGPAAPAAAATSGTPFLAMVQ